MARIGKDEGLSLGVEESCVDEKFEVCVNITVQLTLIEWTKFFSYYCARKK